MTPVLIGIAGGTGSGKTTVATRLVDALPSGRAVLVEQDWYYRDRSYLDETARESLNFDEPDALENDLLIADLEALKAGRDIDAPRYDYASHTRKPGRVHVRAHSVVVVEGILLFAVPALRDVFDIRLFVDTDDDIRLLRRIKRDVEERGRDVSSIETQYLSSVRPMHTLHVAPSRAHAHLIVPEGGDNAQVIEGVVGRLLYLLGDRR